MDLLTSQHGNSDFRHTSSHLVDKLENQSLSSIFSWQVTVLHESCYIGLDLSADVLLVVSYMDGTSVHCILYSQCKIHIRCYIVCNSVQSNSQVICLVKLIWDQEETSLTAEEDGWMEKLKMKNKLKRPFKKRWGGEKNKLVTHCVNTVIFI